MRETDTPPDRATNSPATHTSPESVRPTTRGRISAASNTAASATSNAVRIHLVRPGRVVSLTSRFPQIDMDQPEDRAENSDEHARPSDSSRWAGRCARPLAEVA